MLDLEKWLIENKLGYLLEPLKVNEINFELLLELSQTDLKEMGLTLGARKRLQKAIADWKDATASMVAAESGDVTAPVPAEQALKTGRVERRHLTVMFVDLVGSTALSVRLDPEDLLNLMGAYRKRVRAVIEAHEGHVERFLGDGILCFFGWPVAQEDDAERSVRAGLEIAETVGSITGADGEPLQVRIGIASGIVVVGDLIGTGSRQEECIFGETPNLAARLQHLAGPGQVVISETTRRLIGESFDIETLGAFQLKGIEEAATAYLPTHIRDLESRFDAKRPRTLPPMVGRDAELARLKDHWQQAKSGSGLCAIIRGEAGIGKSRLVEALAKEIEGQPHIRIRYQCSPHHSTSPLYPAIRQLIRAGGIAPDDAPEEKLEKLRAILLCGELDILAQLLNIDTGASKQHQPHDARQLRLLTLKALVNEMAALSREMPLLLIVEDTHWIDPTTLELMTHILDRLPIERVLMLVTTRPGFDADFMASPSANSFRLNRLASKDIQTIISQRAGSTNIPPALLSAIEARSDGIPLFIEEITKALLLSGDLADTAPSRVGAIQIPATLQDSLMSRVDKLNVAKDIAQTAACIGREFSGSLLRRIASVNDKLLNSALNQLIEAEIVFRVPHTPGDSYVFKHALVRDAAYLSLLKKRRRDIHGRILSALETQVGSEPEVLAEHAAQAGKPEKSVELWRNAARYATKRCAYHEAALHLEAAIASTTEFADTANGQEQALEMLGWLAYTWIAADGYMSVHACDASRRGVELAARLPESRYRFAPYYAEWTLRLATGPQEQALDLAEAVMRRTQTPGGEFHRFFANAFASYSSLATGRLEQAEIQLQAACKAYDPERHNRGCSRFGHIPGPDMYSRFAFLRLIQGRFDDAVELLDRAHTSRPEGADIHAEAQLLMKNGLIAMFMRDFNRLETYTARLQIIADEYELPLAKINADLYRGSLMIAEQGDPAGIPLFTAASDRYEAEIMIYLSAARWIAQADLLLRAGMREPAKTACDHAEKLIKETGETLAEPELFRLRAEVAAIEGNADQAEAYFQRAIDMARIQGAGLWELRAATGLAKLQAAAGHRDEAQNILRPAFERLPQAKDRPDLIEAGGLLDMLGAA